MTSSRRAFIGTAALACAGAAVGAVPGKEKPNLKIGLLSDIHIIDERSTATFEKALRYFDKRGVDGVMCCGDIADWGLSDQLECAAKTWFKVFPDGRGADGRKVENLMHYGDHDTTGHTYRWIKAVADAYPDEEAHRKLIIPFNDRKAIWERCFKEPWAPIVHKRIKGYDFVLAHFTKGEPGNKAGGNNPGLENFFRSAKFSPGKPIFFSQHRIPLGTVGGADIYLPDDGKTTKLFSEEFPNVVAFCGNAHYVATEERMIWQGGFTCVQVPSLRYSVTLPGRENSSGSSYDPKTPPFSTMGRFDSSTTKHGLMMSVYDDRIVIERLDFEHDNMHLGADWVVPLPFGQEKPYDPAVRAAEEKAPVFPVGAKITLKNTKGKDRGGNVHEFVSVEFPLANSTPQSPRAEDYEVRLVQSLGNVERTLSERRVFSRHFGWHESLDKGPGYCLFPKTEIPSGRKLRFDVTPIAPFGRRGEPISIAVK